MNEGLLHCGTPAHTLKGVCGDPLAGCFYKSERYEHGDSVETPEPCLNCTCQKGVLVCYLRVCPAIGTPAPGCFTARESGQCCPNVFCSGDKKSETTTTPPPPTDDDYYDYPATVDYEAEASTTTTTTTTTTTRRPYTASTRRYSFAPKPVKRPYGGVHDDVELSARTPSVIVEQTETTTTEADVTTTTARGASTTTTEEAQAKPDVTTSVPLATTFAPTTKPSPTTTTTPEDVVTVTATGIAPTATTPHSVTTFTAVVGGEDDDAAPTVKADSPGAGLGFGPKEVHGASRTTTTSPTTRRHETSASTKPAGQVASTSRKPSGVEEGPKVVATETTTTARPSTLAGITETPVEEQPVGDGEFVTGTAANEFETPVRRPLTEDEPANSVEDGSLGGRDSIMFVSSTPMPYELHHSFDLQDLNTVSGGNDEKKEAVDGSPQTDQLRPVYGQAHLYNATSLGGASVIESRYPVKENDTLQPVYGTVPAYHRPTAESSIGKVDSLRPRYGKPPSFREESSEELISHMHTQVSTTAEVHYEPALSLDAYTPSDKKSLTLNKAVNSTAENSKTQSDSSHQENTAPGTENRPHISIAPKDLTPIYYDVRKYTTTTPSPAATFTTEDNSARLSTLTTSATTMSVYSTSQGTKDVVINATTASNMTKEAQEQHTNLETTTGPDHNIWELMFFNRHYKDNKTEDSNEITNKTADHKKPAEEVAITTSVIKVRVGNTLNVSIDNSNQSKYRNVEEDGIIVSVYPEHQMDGGVTDVQDMPLPGQAESRAISSGDSFKSIQHSGDKAKSPAELTQVISDIIKAHKSEEPEVITAPNIDFSKPNVMTVKVSPSNSFNVFSLILLDKNGTSERGTTSTTEPPVDNAPWAPMGTAAEDSSALRHSAEYANYNQTASATPTSTESFESQASLTVQTQIPSHGASEIISHSEKPALHSTFRIVPFLAEDAIFKPATSTQPSLANDTGAYPRIVNTDPRDTVEGEFTH
ncbi:hypothetical protein V5799_021840 [Amblyomma americanum]|uniref:VWFC domain-containing protein n=1 Tax=Amblyomma americanum TaxID=6943 RepID=A0AAQ4FM81_AMBAM